MAYDFGTGSPVSFGPQVGASVAAQGGPAMWGGLAGGASAAAPAAAGGGLSALMAGGMGGPITMGAGMIASYFAGKSAARDAKKADQRGARQRMNEEAYSKALDDWYKRRDKADWRNGAGNFEQFSSMKAINPNYQNNYVAAEVGAAPTTDGYVAGDKKKFTDMNNKAQQEAASKTLSSYGGG